MLVIEDQEFTGCGLEIDVQDLHEDLLIKNCYFHGFDHPDMDGLQINNDIPGQRRGIAPRSFPTHKVIVEGCYFTNQGYPPDAMDELASVVRGSRAVFRNSLFENNGKAVLCSSGNAVDIEGDRGHLHVTVENCIFRKCSRRSIYAQHCRKATMRDCLVEDWGHPDYFHEKSFGTRVGSTCYMEITRTLYYQRPFFQCLNKHLLSDMFRNTFPWLPGFMRGVTVDRGGAAVLEDCYTNRPWVSLGGLSLRNERNTESAIAQYLRLQREVANHAYELAERLLVRQMNIANVHIVES